MTRKIAKKEQHPGDDGQTLRIHTGGGILKVPTAVAIVRTGGLPSA